MEWNKLLSSRRIGREQQNPKDVDPRTDFTRDWDRIIFSSAFRRMQDKTQVFPLAKNDYIRTRLTHSLEVASVGRSLGMLVGKKIILKKEPNLAVDLCVTEHDFGAIVAAACLAHDIGNPPFGHAGESAIQEWFYQNKHVLEGLSEQQKEDFLSFEGNAQGFRLLTKIQNSPQLGGIQLTHAVLGAFTKYPRPSVVENEQKRGISGKKFGFMTNEGYLFKEVAEELGLKEKKGNIQAWYRHPLSFLVEAADDICYHIMDIEDGFKAGVIPFSQLEMLHEPWIETIHKDKLKMYSCNEKKAEYLRAVTINKIINEAVNVFDDNYEEIMNGSFDSELSSLFNKSKDFGEFKKAASNQIYITKPVLEIEACGFEVIGGLLDVFVKAILTKCGNGDMGKVRTRTLLNLLPNDISEHSSAYKQLLLATDFVSGMTDSYAVELYQRIKGISLP